jgi:hypothetical protein
MIYIYKAPSQNSILLDANNTLISITSSNGLGFYFRAKIFIDEQLFDEQSWSRKDNVTAEKDLKKLYNAYYETVFNPYLSGLQQQTHLIKKITIVINEHSMGDDSLVQTKTLPDFYLMYNTKPVVFNDQKTVQFLGVDPDILQISATGKIAIPFMVNANNEALLVELKDNFGNTINSQSKPNFTDKRVYAFGFDLSSVELVANTLWLSLTIKVGTTVISKNFRLFAAPNFNIKEIAFLNSFGYWCYAYLDGQLSIDDNLDIKTYEELEGLEKVYEIDEKQTYTINTGSLLGSEKDIIRQIATALEAKIYLNSQYIQMINGTKKINLYKDRNNLYSENLSFSVRQYSSVENTYYEENDYDENDYDSNDYTT